MQETEIVKKSNYYEMWKDLAKYFHKKTGYETVVYPTQVKINRLHLAIMPSCNMELREDDHVFFPVLIQARGPKIVSEEAINQAFACRIALGKLLQQSRGGILGGKKAPAMLHTRHVTTQSIRELVKDTKALQEDYYLIAQWECRIESLLKYIERAYGDAEPRGITITDAETGEIIEQY